MRCFRHLLPLIIAATLVSCGDDKSAEPTASSTQAPSIKPAANEQNSASKQTQAVPGRSEYDPVSPDIHVLPARMAFDPCSLFSSEFAQSLKIPLDQRMERIGGTRKIPEDHRYTPYIGCVWRSVVHGVPRVSVEIQQGAENLKVNGDPLAGLGDAAWFGERRGRTELRMHLGDYVIFIKAELPHDRLDSKQIHEAIAKHLVKALEVPPTGSQLPLEASVFGGPGVNMCDAVKGAGIADLLPGPKAWAFPTGAINKVPDEKNAKPDADYVGCNFAGTTRGAVHVRFLGPHGIKRQHRLYNTQTPVTIGGIEGYRNRNGVYLPYGDGAFELSETMAPFENELLPQKLEEIMQNIIETVKK